MTAAEQLAIERQCFQNEARSIKQDHDEGAEYWAEKIVCEGFEYHVRGDAESDPYGFKVICREAVEESAHEGQRVGQDEMTALVYAVALGRKSPDELKEHLIKVATCLMERAFKTEREYLGI